VNRPRLERQGARSWLIWIPIDDQLSLSRRGTSPGEAIGTAVAEGLCSDLCQQCGGTGTSRRWTGDGSEPPCEACNGTGAPSA